MNPVTVKNDFEKICNYSSAALHEAFGKKGALPKEIKPMADGFQICGYAFTVSTVPGDNLWLHHAIYQANPGDIIVADTGKFYEAGYWGEIMSVAALERNVSGLVIDGCIRDIEPIEKLGFPVFARGLCIQGTSKTKKGLGGMHRSIKIGKTVIRTGDLVVGDRDGVVVIKKQEINNVLKIASTLEQRESMIIDAIKQGKSTIEIMNLTINEG